MSGTSDIDGNDQLRSSFLPVEAAGPSIARPEANLRQHRTIRQEPVARDFSSAESLENRGILGVFPVFQTVRMGEKTRHPAADAIVRCCPNDHKAINTTYIHFLYGLVQIRKSCNLILKPLTLVRAKNAEKH